MSYRVCFEDRAIFVINDPRKVAKFKKEGKKLESISYEFAQKELSRQFVESIEGGEHTNILECVLCSCSPLL